MSDFAADKSRLSLPATLLISMLIGVSSAGVTWGAVTARIAENERRTQQAERRIDRLEETVQAMRPMLERIDERTAEMKRQLDRR